MHASQAIVSASATAGDRQTLWAGVINALQPATAAEIGVFEGAFASHLLKHCPSISRYYLVDPWRHLDNWNKPANKSDPEFRKIKDRALAATQFAQDRRVVLEGRTSDVAGQLPDGGLDFVYVDGDHTLRGITIDLLRLWPKLRPGAILAGDDFCASVWQHKPQFEPTFVFPWAVHFAEAMDCPIYGLPFNQFAIVVNSDRASGFAFHDLTRSYASTTVRDAIANRNTENTQFAKHYGDFRFDEDCRNLEITGLHKESGRIRGEIVKTVRQIPGPISRVLLPGESNAVKDAYAGMFKLGVDRIVTAGLSDDVDHRWNFEQAAPDFGKFDIIVSQAMLEHLLRPFDHVRDLVEALTAGGHLVMHTVLPGFPYHRYPIDCVRFFPDWFEEVARRLDLEICDKYIGDLRIMYRFRKRSEGLPALAAPQAGAVASRAMAVLGMHRSGTSALAGSLRDAGVRLGKVLDKGFALNPTGLQEPPSVLYMHENLLEASGGSWHEPPGSVEWKPLHRAVRDLFIESRNDTPLWGFKDPRSLLVLDGWLDVLPGLDCVGIFRHPAEVAASMHQRNGFELDKCFRLWETYNRRLLEYQDRLGFPSIEFVADEARMRASMDSLLRRLNLGDGSDASIFEVRHRHFDRPSIEVPHSSRQLLEALRQRAVRHEA